MCTSFTKLELFPREPTYLFAIDVAISLLCFCYLFAIFVFFIFLFVYKTSIYEKPTK